MGGAARPWSIARARAAIARRIRGPYAGLDRVEGRQEALAAQAGRIEARQEALSAQVGRIEDHQPGIDRVEQRLERVESQLRVLSESFGMRGDVRHALRALGAEEPRNRRLLQATREGDDYDPAWSEPEPLVTVTVATIGRLELVSRSLPSILAQTHERLEVIVAADGAPPETEAAVAALGDDRVRYLDLGPGQTWTDDPVRLWLVGGTRARNAALKPARGRWVVEFDDDDALRPECVASLLDLARNSRAEAVYGQVAQHSGRGPREFCEFPPRLGRFTWAAGMYHAGLRFFGRDQLAADLGLPGDWWLAERMLRAGVRFAMRDEVLCDVYPSERARDALEVGRIPWSADGEGRSWG